MEKKAVSPTLIGVFVIVTLNASKSTIDSFLQDVITKTIIIRINIFFIAIFLKKINCLSSFYQPGFWVNLGFNANSDAGIGNKTFFSDK